jgi:hypothetical protein
LKPNQAKHLLELRDLGNYTQAGSLNSSGSDDQRSTAPRQDATKSVDRERPFAQIAAPAITNTETGR